MDLLADRKNCLFSLFAGCDTPDLKVKKIIALGRTLPPMPEEYKREENRVIGCQSIVYLYSYLEKNNLYFIVSSEALISAGLAALLLEAYNGIPPELLLQSKPTFLSELGIYATLSPGRSNGLSSMFLRMQKDALKFLL